MKIAHAYFDAAAKEQIFRAAEVCLGMPDDLARSPDNTYEYQTPDSSLGCQMFLFTSCGSKRDVWIACLESGQGVSAPRFRNQSTANKAI